jgi:hypothetical protein
MRRTLLPCVAAAFAAFCITAPARAQPVTLAGTFTGTILSQGPGRCSSGVTVDLALSGLLSPFGAATGTQQVCVNPTTFRVFDGRFTFTLVGGTLFGTSFGQLTPIGPMLFSNVSTFVITGGTGRFVDATGGGSTSGTQNVAAGTVAVQVQGNVSAPALVPEPATLVLTAGGLGALGAAMLRRRRA